MEGNVLECGRDENQGYRFLKEISGLGGNDANGNMD